VNSCCLQGCVGGRGGEKYEGEGFGAYENGSVCLSDADDEI